MPIYEYECGSCHLHFERKQRFDEEPIAICPKCQGQSRRVLCSVPVIFKGSGFYVTDRRQNSDGEKTGEKTPDKGKGKEPAGGEGATTKS